MESLKAILHDGKFSLPPPTHPVTHTPYSPHTHVARSLTRHSVVPLYGVVVRIASSQITVTWPAAGRRPPLVRLQWMLPSRSPPEVLARRASTPPQLRRRCVSPRASMSAAHGAGLGAPSARSGIGARPRPPHRHRWPGRPKPPTTML